MLFAGFLFVVYAAIIILSLIQLDRVRQQALADTRENVSTLAALFDDQIQRTFQSIDILAEATSRDIVAGERMPYLSARMAGLSNLPELRGLVFANPKGLVVASSMGPEDLGTDLSSDEGIVAVRSGKGPALHIGRPVGRRSVGSSTTGGPAFFPVTKAVVDDKGNELGFLVVLVSANYFEMQYRTIGSRQGARVYLSRYDGALLASTSGSANRTTEWRVGNPIFSEFLPDRERNVFDRTFAATGAVEIIGYRVTRHWPIVIAVGVDRQFALANWRAFVWQWVLAVVLLLLLITVGIVYLARHDRIAARQRAFLQSVLDHMGDGLAVFSKTGEMMACNRRFRAIFDDTDKKNACPGSSREVAARMLRLTESSRGNDRRHLAGVLRRTLYSAEVEMRSGSVLDIRSADMPDSGAIFLISDVTERRKQALSTQRGEATKRAVIDSALDCIVVADQRGRITEFNPAAERTFGWSAGEIVGKYLHETIVPPDMRSNHLHGMRQFEKTGTGPVINNRIEVPALRKNGDLFPCELAITPINVGGETHFTAYLRDISESKKTQRDLEEAREAAERANVAKSSFLASISHEIRTPMNAIIGYAELLSDTEMDADQQVFAKGIAVAAEGLLELINDVLDLERLEAGKLEIASEPLSPMEIGEGVSRITRVLAEAKRLRFETEIDCEESVYLRGDASRIRQILLNLVGNAVKFTDEGVVRFRLCVVPDSKESAVLECAVSDTGIGIAQDALDLIFQPFEQVQEDASKVGGSGLGLTISRDLARRMGGDIEVVSERGSGTTFTLRLPLEREKRSDDVPESLESATAKALPPMRILVAEDTPASQLVIRRLLEKRGHEVSVVGDGFKVAEVVSSFRPDIVFMDMQMPVMDGLSATRQLRSLGDKFSSLPIIALTAQAFASDREKALAAGMSDFITKPVRTPDLDRVLRIWAPYETPAVMAAGTEASGGDGDYVDTAMLDMLVAELGPETASVIVAKSIDNARELLGSIGDLQRSGDMESLQRTVHSLSGLLQQFGFSDLGIRMEKAEADPAKLRELNADEILGSFERSVARVTATLDRQDPSGFDAGKKIAV